MRQSFQGLQESKVVVVSCGRGGGGGWGSSWPMAPMAPMSNGDGDSWACGVKAWASAVVFNFILLLFFFFRLLFGRESDGEGNCWAGGGKASESLIVFAWVVFMPLGDSCCGFSHGGFGSAHT